MQETPRISTLFSVAHVIYHAYCVPPPHQNCHTANHNRFATGLSVCPHWRGDRTFTNIRQKPLNPGRPDVVRRWRTNVVFDSCTSFADQSFRHEAADLLEHQNQW